MKTAELDEQTRLQIELVAAAYKPAAERLEEYAAILRAQDGVARATVHCPDADDLAFDWPDSILAPSLEVECHRGHECYEVAGLRRIGDGDGSVGPIWIFAI